MYINCLQLRAKPVLVVVSICLLLITARTSDSLDGAATQTDNDTALCRRDPLVARSGVRARHKHASAFAAAKVQPHQLDEWQNTKLHQQDSLTGLYVSGVQAEAAARATKASLDRTRMLNLRASTREVSNP